MGQGRVTTISGIFYLFNVFSSESLYFLPVAPNLAGENRFELARVSSGNSC